ncbi:unnamed protein product [Symbiodinium sp. CCMP2592]|nr:unnamed protein product [Symbiodinium sp. CCMP2592]
MSADGDYMREYVRETCDQALGQLANGQVPLAEMIKSMQRIYRPDLLDLSTSLNGQTNSWGQMLSCLNMCYHGDETRQKILETIAWSLEALARGKFPATDPWDVPFSKSYEPHRFKKAGANLVETSGAATCGIFDGIQADLEFVKRILFLKRNLT